VLLLSFAHIAFTSKLALLKLRYLLKLVLFDYWQLVISTYFLYKRNEI